MSQLNYRVCVATFSICHALHYSHRDERSVSSVVPEMEAPGPSPDPPGSGRGFFFVLGVGWRRPDQSTSRHHRCRIRRAAIHAFEGVERYVLVRVGLGNDQVSAQEFKLRLLPDIAKFFIFALELL